MKTDTKELNAVVLDVLMKGNLEDQRAGFRREPVVQAVGTDQFKLLELVPKKTEIRIHERVYIGDGEREKVERVKRRIFYQDLTQVAQLELPLRGRAARDRARAELRPVLQPRDLDQPETPHAPPAPRHRQETDVGGARGA